MNLYLVQCRHEADFPCSDAYFSVAVLAHDKEEALREASYEHELDYGRIANKVSGDWVTRQRKARVLR